ncbi:hypothetical protein L202_02292 [Cryptococcus amylolentus CBS 6039]|uniref:Uncharacterized protein n=1 Tax=Cryptococcus amylolentus CBS 6039 TaxID=1295533 RepID=A0A1E3I1T5_9TREE|nr:hypothetical protein L202_02292 [Cryptococcus amylolentus CBS 6039]ODN81956.1 hypothetical protein L202_02292 [Cryptococcus amylolentus CBS 6039]
MEAPAPTIPAYNSSTQQPRPAPPPPARPLVPPPAPVITSAAPTTLNGHVLTSEEQGWINNRQLPNSATDAGIRARAFLNCNDLCIGAARRGTRVDGERFYRALEDDLNDDNPLLVPLIIVNIGLSADSPIATGLFDPGAAINTVSESFVKMAGLRKEKVTPLKTRMADGRPGPHVDTRVRVDVFIGQTLYKNSPFLIIPTSCHVDLILGLPFCLQHRLLEGAARLDKLI